MSIEFTSLSIQFMTPPSSVSSVVIAFLFQRSHPDRLKP